MNTHRSANKAKVSHLCFFLIMCLHHASGSVPGPCKHSVTKEHLLNFKRLIGNQLQNGCSVTYAFTDRRNLSEICYVKAAFPLILDLLNTQFMYAPGSDSYRYVYALKRLIYNIFSQKCIPQINEEIEEHPVKFVKIYTTLPRVGLQKAEEVILMYMNLMTDSNSSVDWNCEDEYAEDYPESTTVKLSTSGTSECACSYSKVDPGASTASVVTTTLWQVSSKPHLSHLTPTELPGLSPSTVRASRHLDGQLSTAGPVSHGETIASGSSGRTDQATKTDAELNVYDYGDGTQGAPPNLLSATPTASMDDRALSHSKAGTEASLELGSVGLTGLPSQSQGRTAPATQPTTSSRSHRDISDIPPRKSDESTALGLAKRSAENHRVHRISAKSKPDSLREWLARTRRFKWTGQRNAALTRTWTVTEKLSHSLQAEKETVTVTDTAPVSLEITDCTTGDREVLSKKPATDSHSTPTHSFMHMNQHGRSITKERRGRGSAEVAGLSSSDWHGQDSTEEPRGRNISYHTTFMIASVCGVLLLVLATKFRKHLHRSKVNEIQRNRTNSSNRPRCHGGHVLLCCEGN